MPSLPFIIPRLAPYPESFCSRCGKTVRPTQLAATLARAEADHICMDPSPGRARLKGRYARIRALSDDDA